MKFFFQTLRAVQELAFLQAPEALECNDKTKGQTHFEIDKTIKIVKSKSNQFLF